MELLFWLVVIIGIVSGVPFAVGFGVGQAVERRRRRKQDAEAPRTSHQPYQQAPLSSPPPYSRGGSQQWGSPAEENPQGQGFRPSANEPGVEETRAAPAQQLPASLPPAQHQSLQQASVQHRPSYPQYYPRQESPEDRAAEKKRRERRNINVALYIGGLLLVAAALAFIAVVGDPVLTAVSLTGVCAAFTAGGFVTARLSTVLRPAGIALYGTGLSLLPVLGLPLNEAIIGNGLLTWLLISVVGVAVYVHGAVALDSRVLGYLVIPFLYSSVFAATAVLRPAIFWALLLIIAASALLQLLMVLLERNLPDVLTRPFGQLHGAVVPGVLVASLVLVGSLHRYEFATLFAVASIYYLVTSFHTQSDVVRLIQRVAVRPLWLLASAALLSGLGLTHMAFHTIQVGWLVLFYLAVALVPGFTVVRWGQQDRRIMLAVVVAASGLLQLRNVLSDELTSTGHAWMIILSLLTITAAAHSLVLTRDTAAWTAPVAWQFALRGVVVVYAVTALPSNVGWTLVWALVWLIAEWRLSEPVWRSTWQRAAGLAAACAAGLSLGMALDDQALGHKTALAGVMAAAGLYAIVLLVRARTHTGHRRVLEAWAWAALVIPLAAVGIEVFALEGIGRVPYLMGTAVLLYAVVLLTPQISGPGGPDLRIARVSAFAGSLLIVTAAIDWNEGIAGSAGPPSGTSSEAGVVLAGALVLAAGEAIVALRLRFRACGPRPAVRNWAPLHLAGNLLWLASVNAVLALSGADGALYWVTALPWAVSAVVLLWREDLLAPRAALIGPAVYTAAVGALMLAGLVSPERPWWAALVIGLAGIVLSGLSLRHLDAEIAAISLPLYSALGGALLILGPLQLAGAGPAPLIYLASFGGFAAVISAAGIGLRLCRSGQMKLVLIAAAAGLAFGASLVPLIAAPTAEPAWLGWLIPAMHGILLVAGLRRGPSMRRTIAALAGSLVLPPSLLFAWSQHYELTAVTSASALLFMLAALMISEFLLSRRPVGPHLFFAGGAAVIAGLVMIAYPAAELFAQAAPLLGGVVLLACGMIRSSRIGVWAGAVLPLLAPAPQSLPELVWVLPALHGLVFVTELRRTADTSIADKSSGDGAGSRLLCCLTASLVLPASAQYAWAQTVGLSQNSLAATLLVMLAGLLLSEFLLAARREVPENLSQSFFGAGGVVATASAGMSFTGDSVFAQTAPLIAATVLLACALLRSNRMGTYWGAALIVLSVLWWLRGFTVLLLVTLGVLVIGVAIWRLLVISRGDVTSGE